MERINPAERGPVQSIYVIKDHFRNSGLALERAAKRPAKQNIDAIKTQDETAESR